MYLRARCLLAALGLGFDIERSVRHGWEIGDINNDTNHINTWDALTCARLQHSS